jgi:tungstate transport system substrate-binding protein
MLRSIVRFTLALLVVSLAWCGKPSGGKVLTLATTTSTRDTGLLDALLPRFRAETQIDVKVIAVGTGQALEIGRRGDADVLLVHAPEAELAFMAEGHGESRTRIMYNDFVLLGPAADPAHVRGTPSVAQALAEIARQGATFVSRGDNSGTHQKEQQLFKAAAITPSGAWYKSAGQGMAEVLRIASELGGYTLSDRATFLVQAKAGVALEIVVEKDPALQNPYAAIVVKGDTLTKQAESRKLVEFLTSADTQQRIASFGVDRFGQQLFFTYGDAR